MPARPESSPRQATITRSGADRTTCNAGKRTIDTTRTACVLVARREASRHTSTTPIQNPDGKLQMSGVAVGFDGSQREGAMNGSLIAQLIPFQPTTTRAFTNGDTLRLFARMFYKGKDEPAVTLTITGSGAPVTVTPPVKSTNADAGRMEAVLDTTLPLRNLAAGQHHLSIDARLPNGQTAGRVILFEVK